MAKKLLNEAQMRRFAKLANLRPINEMASYAEDMEEEDGEMPAPDELVDPSGEMPDEMPDEMDAPMDAVEGELTITPAQAAALESLGDQIKNLGLSDESGMGAEMDAPMDAPMDAEMDAPMDAEMDAPMGDDEEEDEEAMKMMEALRGINYIPGKKEIVEEVARRVAKRLLKAKKAERALQEALGQKRKK